MKTLGLLLVPLCLAFLVAACSNLDTVERLVEANRDLVSEGEAVVEIGGSHYEVRRVTPTAAVSPTRVSAPSPTPSPSPTAAVEVDPTLTPRQEELIALGYDLAELPFYTPGSLTYPRNGGCLGGRQYYLRDGVPIESRDGCIATANWIVHDSQGVRLFEVTLEAHETVELHCFGELPGSGGGRVMRPERMFIATPGVNWYRVPYPYRLTTCWLTGSYPTQYGSGTPSALQLSWSVTLRFG